MQPADFLAKAEVESHDVDEACEGEEGGDDTLVDASEVGEVPRIGHHDQVADVYGRITQERDQVGPLQLASLLPDKARILRVGPSAMFAAIDKDSDEPDEEEKDEHARSTKTTALESQVSVFDSKNGGTGAHEKASCQ